jgi:hypothetical protein
MNHREEGLGGGCKPGLLKLKTISVHLSVWGRASLALGVGSLTESMLGAI